MATHNLKDLQADAAQGDGNALFLLALAAWDGQFGVEKNVKEAASMLRWATALGSGRAASSLGYYFCCEPEGPKNAPESFEWFKVGAALNSPHAMRNLAISYRDGTGVAKDADLAVHWWSRAGELGMGSAYNDLGLFHKSSAYGRYDSEKARAYFQKAINAGDVASYHDLASSYEYGLLSDQSDKNPVKARSIYAEGALAGCVECWTELGAMYDSEELGAADPAAALSAYIKGGEAGSADSYLRASQLLSRSGPMKNLAEAYAMARNGAALGSVEARGEMGKALAEGQGVPADPLRAAELLREMVARDKSNDPDKRHAVYPPRYWRFGQTLGALIEKKSIPPTYPNELRDLLDRYGTPKANVRRFTVPIQCGNQKIPFFVYVIDWKRPNDENSVQSQAEWLQNQRGCIMPADVLDSFSKLKRIARENKVSFTDMTMYALGSDKDGAPGTKSPSGGDKAGAP